jgi:membrane protease YdiL (CAAX protease family)
MIEPVAGRAPDQALSTGPLPVGLRSVGLRSVGLRSVRRFQWSAAVAGVAILALRPEIARGAGWTVPIVVAVFASVLVIGLATPVTGPAPITGAAPVTRDASVTSRRALVLAGGIAVFALARLAGGHAPAPATFEVIALNTLAAVAEEALFRRVIYSLLLSLELLSQGLLSRWLGSWAGAPVAIGGSALLFGLVHAPVYGWWAVPLDVAAGLVLGWQRWAGGSWILPAFTHSLADLLVVI